MWGPVDSLGECFHLAYIARTMTAIDPEKERKRLAEVYAGMADGELEELAEEASTLSDVARETLRAEIVRRKLDVSLRDSIEPEDHQTPRLVTIRQFRDVPEALMAKTILNSAGIECFLADQNIIWTDWFYSNAVGGVKLRVRAEDAAAALDLLDQSRVEEFEVEGVGEYKQPRCPDCQSLDVSFGELNKRAAYASLFVNLPMPLRHVGWRCHSCGHAWDATDDPQQEAP